MKRQVLLIVDDDPLLRQVLRILLNDQYETMSAKDGLEAIAIVRSRAVDLVLMDVNLPGTDGIKTLEMIKQIDNGIGVIMISASDDAEKAAASVKKGADGYITKPFDNDDLISTIKRYMDGLAIKNEAHIAGKSKGDSFI